MLKEEQILELSSQEYDTLIRKAGQIHEYGVNHSYGIRDYYRAYRKQIKNEVTEQLYSKIIDEVVQAMIDELKKDAYVVLPLGFGFLSTTYLKNRVRIVDSKLKVNGIIDWYKTIKMWYDDEEARNNKQVIYKEKTCNKIAKYSKSGKVFKNKQYLKLVIKRSVFKELTTDYNDKHTIKPIIYG